MPAYSKKLWKSINDSVLRHFALMLIRNSVGMKLDELTAKAKRDLAFLKDVFAGNLVQRDLEESNKFVSVCIGSFMDTSKMLIRDIVDLSLKLKDDFNSDVLVLDHYQKTICKARPEFSAEDQKALAEELKLHNRSALKGKRDLGLEFYKASMKELHVSRFIKLLKKRLAETKKQKQAISASKNQSVYLSINKNEKKVVSPHSADGRNGAQHQRLRIDGQASLHCRQIRPRGGRRGSEDGIFQPNVHIGGWRDVDVQRQSDGRRRGFSSVFRFAGEHRRGVDEQRNILRRSR